MPSTKLTLEEIMEFIYVHPEMSWEQQLRALQQYEKDKENERLSKEVSYSHWGLHVTD